MYFLYFTQIGIGSSRPHIFHLIISKGDESVLLILSYSNLSDMICSELLLILDFLCFLKYKKSDEFGPNFFI